MRIPRVNATCARRSAAGSLLLVAALTSGCARPVALNNTRVAAASALARQNIAQERQLIPGNFPENTLSVAPLTVVSADTSLSSLGFGMAALLVTDLGRSPALVLVERLRLDAVLRELQLARSGRVDTATAPRVGRLVGARRIVVGAIDIRPNSALRIDSYVANVATGRVGSSLSGNASLAQVFDAEKALVFRLFDALGVTLTPAQRRAIEPKPTRNLAAFLAFSRGARAEAFGDLSGAASYYAQALRIDPGFSLAGQGLASLQGISMSAAYYPTFVSGAALISADLINRPSNVLIGSGIDIPVSSLQQTITFTITVRTP